MTPYLVAARLGTIYWVTLTLMPLGFDRGFSKTRFEIVSQPSNARVRIGHLHFGPAQ
jgi:hypothetical protein